MESIAGQGLCNLELKVFIGSFIQGKELDARPVQRFSLLAPDENAVFLPVDAIIEADYARIEAVVDFNPNPGRTDIHDFGNVVR